MADDFCIEHGYEFMKSEMGNPIPYCTACDLRAQNLKSEAAMIGHPNMTAAEVEERKKAFFANWAAERADRPHPFQAAIDQMLKICKERGFLD